MKRAEEEAVRSGPAGWLQHPAEPNRNPAIVTETGSWLKAIVLRQRLAARLRRRPRAHCTTIRRDPRTGREIEPPDVHAGKLHALLAGLDCLHDTSQVFAARDMAEIRSWLIHMAREESTLLRLAFDPTAMDDGDAQ